eukprot:s11359_g2.t1
MKSRSLPLVDISWSCGPPCRYVKRKGGCRDGQSCTNCHQCFWVGKQVQPAPASDKGRQEADMKPKTRRPDRQVPTSSVGTVGHPLTCAEPCVEAWQPGGCSRGSACQQCHRCRPMQQLRTVAADDSASSSAAASTLRPSVHLRFLLEQHHYRNASETKCIYDSSTHIRVCMAVHM